MFARPELVGHRLGQHAPAPGRSPLDAASPSIGCLTEVDSTNAIEPPSVADRRGRPRGRCAARRGTPTRSSPARRRRSAPSVSPAAGPPTLTSAPSRRPQRPMAAAASRSPRRGVGQVAGQRPSPGRPRPATRSRLLQRRLVAGAHQHPRALRGQHGGRGQAQSAARAGDDVHTVLQSEVHDGTSCPVPASRRQTAALGLRPAGLRLGVPGQQAGPDLVRRVRRALAGRAGHHDPGRGDPDESRRAPAPSTSASA